MDDNQSHLFDNFQLNPPLTEEVLAQLEKKLGMQLPDEYLRILGYANGLEGTLSDKAYVILWSAEELVANNAAVDAPRLIPGILLIGTASDAEAIAIDMRESRESYGCFFLLALSPLDWDDAEPLGCTIEEAFEKLKNPFSLPDEESSEPLSEKE